MASTRCLCYFLRSPVYTTGVRTLLTKNPTHLIIQNSFISINKWSQWSNMRLYSNMKGYRPASIYAGSIQQQAKSNTANVGLAEELLASKRKSESKDDSKQTEDEEKENREAKERSQRAMKFSFYVFALMCTTMGVSVICIFGPPTTDENGEGILDEFSKYPIVLQYFFRTFRECNNMNKMMKEPARIQLLPDTVKEPYFQPPYTLVLEFRDILVHPEWTYETGWRFKKRPGVEFLLNHCAPPNFEIVIYTNEPAFTAFPLIDQLDPNGYIWYRLFKDSTRYVEGKHIKDLNCLNRDLNKVIAIDWDGDAISNSRNHLKLKRWDGNMNDQTLVDLGVMLRTIAESDVSDVREVLDYYRGFDNPVEAFQDNKRAAQELELQVKQKVEKDAQSKGLAQNWTSSFLRKH